MGAEGRVSVYQFLVKRSVEALILADAEGGGGDQVEGGAEASRRPGAAAFAGDSGSDKLHRLRNKILLSLRLLR